MKPQKIDPEQFEREQRDKFDYGDLKQTAHHGGFRYNTFTKQMEPENPTPSIATEFLNFLYGCHMTRPELEAEVWALVCRARRGMFPSEEAENDLGDAIAACGDFVGVATRFEDGLRTPEELADARRSVLESFEKGTWYPPSADLGNLG